MVRVLAGCLALAISLPGAVVAEEPTATDETEPRTDREAAPEAPVEEAAPEAAVVEAAPEAPGVEAAPEAAVVEAAPEAPLAEAAPAAGKHCLGAPHSKLMIKQSLAVSINPLGPEHNLTLAKCVPLIEDPGMLFMLTNIEAGLFSVLNAPYSHLGAYVSVTPLSVLVMRAEIQGVSIWPVDAFDGAGFFPMQSYDQKWRDEGVPKGSGQAASGFATKLSTKLQVEFPIGPLALAITNNAEWEYWTIGDSPLYFNMRRDLILPRSAWLYMNTGMVVLGYDITDNIKIRAGLMDYIIYVPESTYLMHRLSGLVTVSFARLGSRVRNLQPFVAVGGYTHHGVRAGEVNLLVGIATTYDLSEAAAPAEEAEEPQSAAK